MEHISKATEVKNDKQTSEILAFTLVFSAILPPRAALFCHHSQRYNTDPLCHGVLLRAGRHYATIAYATTTID